MISVPVMSPGIKSGVNWMRRKVKIHRFGQRPHHQRLGQPGNAFQQTVAAGENRDQQLLDDVS